MNVLYLIHGIHQMTQQEAQNKDQTIKIYWENAVILLVWNG